MKEKLLYDDEFLDQLAQRMIRRITAGKSEGNEVLRQVGEHVFTHQQLDRFKKAFIFLVSQDEDFRAGIRKAMRRYIDAPVKAPLHRTQLIRRIQEFGPLAFMHKGRMRGFYAQDVYAALGEYSQREVLQMLQDTKLLLTQSSRVHPKTGKNNRTMILDV